MVTMSPTAVLVWRNNGGNGNGETSVQGRSGGGGNLGLGWEWTTLGAGAEWRVASGRLWRIRTISGENIYYVQEPEPTASGLQLTNEAGGYGEVLTTETNGKISFLEEMVIIMEMGSTSNHLWIGWRVQVRFWGAQGFRGGSLYPLYQTSGILRSSFSTFNAKYNSVIRSGDLTLGQRAKSGNMTASKSNASCEYVNGLGKN